MTWSDEYEVRIVTGDIAFEIKNKKVINSDFKILFQKAAENRKYCDKKLRITIKIV